MPVIVVGAAAFAGYELATAATLSVWETVAAIGAVTAGVGTVTGNKDLTKIGGLMAAVGGIGDFATSSGIFAPQAAASAGGEADGLITQFGSAPAADAATAPSGLLSKTGEDFATTGVAPTAAPTPAGGIPNEPLPAGGMQATGPGLFGQNTPSATKDLLGGQRPTAAPPSFMDSLKNFVGKNDKTTAAILQVGGNFAAGVFNKKTPAEIELINAQAKALQQRTLAGSAAAPNAVTGAPRPPVYGQTGVAFNQPSINTGLINTPAPTVTGVPT